MFELTKYQFYGKGMPIIPFKMISDDAPVRFPSSPSDYYGDIITLDRTLIKNPDFTYLVSMAGDSMLDAGILPGSWMVVDRAAEPANGSIIVARINGELTVKYYNITTEACTLMPANPKHEAIHITKHIDFAVWGVVIHIITATKSVGFIRFI